MTDDLTLQKRVRKRFRTPLRSQVVWKGDKPTVFNAPTRGIDLSQTTLSFRTARRPEEQTDPAVLMKELQVDLRRNPLDTGHEFYTRKQSISMANPSVNYKSPYTAAGSFWEHHGAIYLGRPDIDLHGDFDDYHDSSALRNQARKHGTEFIAQTIPTQSHASLAQFAGELREGLPDILGFDWKKTRSFRPDRDGGSLSLQFGWLPFIRDLTKMFEAVVNSQQILERYVQNSAEFGSTVRRRRRSAPEVEVRSDKTDGNAIFPNNVESGNDDITSIIYGFDGSPRVRNVRRFETSTVTWSFSARYMYSIPEADGLLGRLHSYVDKANHLLGIRLTPEVLYELTPWSWLLDWQTDIGSIISNATAFSQDALAMQYGYVMREETREVTYLSDPFRPDSNTSITLDTSYRTDYKMRWQASPYGFGTSFGDLSQSQLDILLSLVSNKGKDSSRRAARG